MSSDNDSRSFVPLRNLLNNLPHEASSLGIHTRGRLIEQDNGWVTNQGHGHRQLSLISSTQSSSELVNMVLQVKITDSFLNNTIDLVSANTLDQSVELEMLLNSQCCEDGVVLGSVTDKLSGILELRLDIVTLHRNLAHRWSDIPC